MGSHFHGGAMITRMHALMFPLLSLVALLLLLDRVVKPLSQYVDRVGGWLRGARAQLGHL